MVALAGFSVGAFAVEGNAQDWRAEKIQALAYYDAYAKYFTNEPEAQTKIAEVREIAKNIERREASRNSRTKALLVLREADSQKRSEGIAASNDLADLRLSYLYGNLLPRILNECDDSLVQQGVSPRPFPVRPLAMTEAQFKAKQASLIAQVGLTPNEIDPKPEQ